MFKRKSKYVYRRAAINTLGFISVYLLFTAMFPMDNMVMFLYLLVGCVAMDCILHQVLKHPSLRHLFYLTPTDEKSHD